MRRHTRTLVVLVGLALVVGGLLSGASGAGRLATYLDSTGDVESTEGRVLEVDHRQRVDGQWVVELRYTYVVDGRTYEGTTLNADGTDAVSSRERAAAFVDSHDENDTVSVWYDPESPGRSYVRRSPQSNVLFETSALIVLSVLGVAAGAVAVYVAADDPLGPSDRWRS